MPRGISETRLWDGSSWDRGHRKSGRVYVYRPDYPRCSIGSNWPCRSHIVWWLAGKPVPPLGYVIHHINGIRDDDRLENLQMMTAQAHTSLHKKKKGVDLICQQCGKTFNVPAWRIRSRIKEGRGEVKYCSRKCFYGSGAMTSSRKAAVKVKLICQQCSNPFIVPEWLIKRRIRDGSGKVRFCSRKCFLESGTLTLGRKNISDSVRKAIQEGRK